MTLFILGLIIFFAAHAFTAFMRPGRDALIGAIGAGAYKGLYSLISLAGFVMIVMGWPQADATALYVSPPFLRHVTYLLMLAAIILLVAAYAPAGKIAVAVKHPMLAAVKIWAFAHLLVNGEVRSVILFSAFLIFAIADRIAVKRRGAAVRPAGPWRNDAVAVAIGAGVYVAVAFYLHRHIAGVALF